MQCQLCTTSNPETVKKNYCRHVRCDECPKWRACDPAPQPQPIEKPKTNDRQGPKHKHIVQARGPPKVTVNLDEPCWDCCSCLGSPQNLSPNGKDKCKIPILEKTREHLCPHGRCQKYHTRPNDHGPSPWTYAVIQPRSGRGVGVKTAAAAALRVRPLNPHHPSSGPWYYCDCWKSDYPISNYPVRENSCPFPRQGSKGVCGHSRCINCRDEPFEEVK